MSYQPNFSDPRIKKRCRNAYGFIKGFFGSSERSAGRDLINKYLGHQSDSLGRYLRQLLLVTTDQYYNPERARTKKYKSNSLGLEYLRVQMECPSDVTYNQWVKLCPQSVLNELTTTTLPCVRHVSDNQIPSSIRSQSVLNELTTTTLPCVRHVSDNEIIREVFTQQHHAEFKNLDFQYTDRSNRLWHPIQNLRKANKRDILRTNGLPYEYDISACAYTLILQHAGHLGMELAPQAMYKLIEHKQSTRDYIANTLQIQPKQVKSLLSALLFGAALKADPNGAVYQSVSCDYSRLVCLREDPYITELRADIRECWGIIKSTLPRRAIVDRLGRSRLIPINSKQRSGVYFDLERQVLNSVRRYLLADNNRHFLEHDGWSCEFPIDCEQLQAHVRCDTGFRIIIQENTNE